MREYTIGQISRLLNVKPHILRYWEKELPFLSPKKNLGGRRVYSEIDLQLLYRIRYLIHEKGYTLSGAGKRVWEDLNSSDPNLLGKVRYLRGELIRLLDIIDEGRKKEAMTDTIKLFREKGQEHLFRYWERRDERQRERLIRDLNRLDLEMLGILQKRLKEEKKKKPKLDPIDFVSIDESRRDIDALRAGKDFIRAGKTAFLTVAGGQGSRLGFEGPKGMFPISPIRGASLFQIFSEKVMAARKIYGVPMPWLIMTSILNYEDTVNYFEENAFFGLEENDIYFFKQDVLPSLYPDGRLVLAPDGGLFKNPNGHGGVIEALKRSGMLDMLNERGIEELFYFQVDNPLVQVPDPLFLGWHLKYGSEMSTKVIEKAYPEEKLGSIGLIDGKPGVIEYSDLDLDLKLARNEDGRLLYSHGSIAVHILNVDFLRKQEGKLPYHLAFKSVKTLKPTDTGADIIEEEAVKFEMFLFDAIPFARNPLFFETSRREEFSPLKNREGVDSIETCIRGQIEKYASWLERVGTRVRRDEKGMSVHKIEISPLFALDLEVLKTKRNEIPKEINNETLII